MRKIEEIRPRHRLAGLDAHGKRRGVRVVVHPVELVAGEALEQFVGQHRAGAAQPFLGRLEDEHRRAVEIARLGQVACGAEQHHRVRVVPAGMHHAGALRGPGQVGAFVDRQRVHVGAQADRAAAAVPAAVPATPALQHADDACLADAGMRLDAPFGQQVGDDARRPDLVEPQLGVGMKVAAELGQLGREGGDAIDDGHSVSFPGGAAPLPVPASGGEEHACDAGQVGRSERSGTVAAGASSIARQAMGKTAPR